MGGLSVARTGDSVSGILMEPAMMTEQSRTQQFAPYFAMAESAFAKLGISSSLDPKGDCLRLHGTTLGDKVYLLLSDDVSTGLAHVGGPGGTKFVRVIIDGDEMPELATFFQPGDCTPLLETVQQLARDAEMAPTI